MTQIELRKFCELLPEEPGIRGMPGRKSVAMVNGKPTKSFFADECGISFIHIADIMKGKKPLLEATVSKILPVMRKYGFTG